MRFVIVTGMSGGGKSTALKMLEDAGFYCVDNLPVSLRVSAVSAVVSSAVVKPVYFIIHNSSILPFVLEIRISSIDNESILL